MADYAHTETDKRIEAIEKRLQAEYRQAYKETKGKLEKYLSDFARKDEAKRELVEKGELSQADYTQWRKNQILMGKRWAAMVETLAKDINRTNQIAADIISGDLKGTFALNANFTAYSIENGFRTDYGFTLYNEDTVNRLIAEDPDLLPAPSVDIPKDIRWNKQKISSNITQAVLQGKSIPDIAKGMQTVVGMNKAAATRNARTAMTGAQNAGRQASYDRAKAMGIKVKKEWIATLDGRTRHSHGMADGQQVELDGKFTVGSSKMLYPGDFKNGSPEELYNCRCTMGTVEPPEILQGDEPRVTYQEWVKSKENTGNGLKSGGKSGIMKSGAISGALNPASEEASKHAERYYNSVRKMKNDYIRIAQNTKMSYSDIKNVKNFIFNTKHDLGNGELEYFKPNYEMAQSWQRLIDGKNIQKHDLTLLKHEILEQKLMSEGKTQEEAHKIASKRYNYAKESDEYYDKIARNQKK